MATDATATAASVWRREAGPLVGSLVRVTGDLDLAEDLAQDAMEAALTQWPATGVPANPGAWLMTVAKRRAMDHFRRSRTARNLVDRIGHDLPTYAVDEPVLDPGDRIEDDLLRLIFLTCHPVLPPEGRAALTLRLTCGLTTAEIARAFLVKEPTVGQRISRAKRTLAERRVSFDLPTAEDRRGRLADVMRVVYLIFNEGYAATAGDDWMRPDLCHEALRLARLLARLVPDDAEVHGLQALLEIQASRQHARVDDEGTTVLLEAQDRRRWDRFLIDRGFAALDRAEALGQPAGPYVLQAAIAATHARARTAEQTDWRRIAELYDILAVVTPSPVVEVNRAVAHGRAYGAASGLAVLAPLEHDPAMAMSHLLPSVRGDLLARAGDTDGAVAAFRQAAAMTRNRSEAATLRRRADLLLAASEHTTRG